VAAAEHLVDVMGTRAHVIVTARDLDLAELLAGSAVARLYALEARWSRFRSDSELSALNRGGGATLSVSSDTATLVERSVEAWQRTGGAFDPTVLPALVAAGYDRDFSELGAVPASLHAPSAVPSPGCDGIRVGADGISLPPTVQIDPGGIGKGLAADLVVDLVMRAGADGACVNVGGDLRVAGSALGGQQWSVTVEHPLGGRDLGDVPLHDEALVSSWRTRRAWGTDSEPRHHLIDPTTGAPAWTGLAGVTVLAGEAWWAEALATAFFLAGPDGAPAIVDHHGVSALLVRDDGAVRGFGRLASLVTAG
jgi:thiamine biosynthesis lipoprotein